MLNIIKEKIEIEPSLKKKIEIICEFANIEPHKVLVKNKIFLFFNYSNDIYISNLTRKIKISEFEKYLKNLP